MQAISKISVAEFVKSVARGSVIHWIPGSGNAGDALIAAATHQILRAGEIDFRVVEDVNRFRSDGAIVCYGGGGGLVPQWQTAKQVLERHHQRASHLIVLPQTISGHEQLLASFGTNVTLICREAQSYSYCRRTAGQAEVFAADDLALSFKDSLLAWLPGSNSSETVRATYEELRQKHVDFLLQEGWRQELEVFRDDRERNPASSSSPGNDISLILRTKSSRLADKLVSAHFFVRTIEAFDSIRTDRLHVAIAGALLGKRIKLYANSYYKNRAVYDFSLQSFQNVEFIDT